MRAPSLERMKETRDGVFADCENGMAIGHGEMVSDMKIRVGTARFMRLRGRSSAERGATTPQIGA